MKIVLLAVGKPRDARLAAAHDDYAERIRKFGVSYEARFVAEVKAGGRFSDPHVREREARALDEAIEPGGTVVALDPRGEPPTSEALSRRLERWATPKATFVVGGPLGLDPAFVKRAGAVWSLSPLTFPHELVRVIAAEQIFRALTLLRGVPYHK